jgi:CHAT domain-containing protein
MFHVNPGASRKALIVFFLIWAQMLCAQEIQPPVVRFSHPTMTEINQLVDSYQYQKAISLSASKAQQMRVEKNWEGFIAFMLRAAEIETFEVWKARGRPEIKIQPDYRRALMYLDSLKAYGEAYLNTFPYLKANFLFTSAVVHDWLNHADTAEQIHKEALRMRLDLYGKTSREVADSYLWMGVLYRFNLHRKDWAKRYYEEALPLQKKYMPDSRHAVGSIYYGLASIARENFEFDEAIAMATQYSSLYTDVPSEQASAHQLIANIYFNKHDYEKSLEQRMKAIDIYERSGYKAELILAYGNLSDNLKELGRYQEALKMLQKGISIASQSGDRNFYYEKNLYENLGEIYRAMGQHDSAESYLNKAFTIAIENFGKHNEEVADVLNLRGTLYVEQGKFNEGITDYQQMLSAVIPDFTPTDIYTVPPVQNESPYFPTIIAALFSKGDAMLEWYRKEKNPTYLNSSINQYRAAFHQLMVARRTIGDELSKPFLISNFERSIEQSIQCAHLLFQLTSKHEFFDDIFHFIELTKYLNVLDAMQRAERASNSNIPKALLFDLEDVKTEINRVQKEILQFSDASGDTLTSLNRQRLSLIERRRLLMNEISKHPDWKFTQPDSLLLNIGDVQQILSRDDQILEYFWGKDNIYIVSITRDKNSVSSVATSKEIEQVLASVYQHMSGDYSLKKEDIKKYSDASSIVYKKLFGPFIEKTNLIIIPDGLLNVISADALVITSTNTANSYNELDYAILHHNISYAYSANILCKDRALKLKKIENVLAFSYSDGVGGPSIALRNQQASLPGTFKELEALSRLFKNVKRFTNEDASKINFVRNTSGSDIIHLGVHGVGDEDVEDNSRLIFQRDSLNDPELYAYEIYNLKLTARLVVLSACESGLGRNQRGEGMFSIARAFTYAGCPAAVMSLWKARDVFTADVMVQFYENLHEGESVSNALRNAKLQFLKEADGPTAHPANWAAFVLNGHDMAFQQKAGFHFAWYVVAALLLAASVTYVIRRNKKNSTAS